MTLATLAIHTEAWLQEELGAQRALLNTFARLEAAARAGSSADMEQHGGELQALLAPAAAREGRRTALLERLAKTLGLAPRETTLARLSSRLAAQRIESKRLDGLRQELREVTVAVVEAGRRLAAMAQYHRGVLEELCQSFINDGSGRDGRLIDARG